MHKGGTHDGYCLGPRDRSLWELAPVESVRLACVLRGYTAPKNKKGQES